MIIGVTGGIASGKSEVCRILEREGFIHIDADDVAHDVLEIPEIIGELTEIFGDGILYAVEENMPQQIDRKKLGRIVFTDELKMNILEKITHPRIVRIIKEYVQQNPDNNYVIEAIELVSSGLAAICDELWVVHAEREQQINRLVNNRHLTTEEAIKRLESQENHDWDEAKADRIIYSTEPISTMETQVKKALNSMAEK